MSGGVHRAMRILPGLALVALLGAFAASPCGAVGESTGPVGDSGGKHPTDLTAAVSGGFVEPTGGTRFIAIRGGTFSQGDNFNKGDKDEQPAHPVTVGDFYLAATPVTVGEFRRFVEATGFRTDAEKGGGCYVERHGPWDHDPDSSWRNPGFRQTNSHPVVCVSWNDAGAYADWLSRKQGRRFRLPTEAEWEYAARSGGRKERFAGFSEPGKLARYANFCDRRCQAEWRTEEQDDGYRYTSPVGSYSPNGLGLFDMVGNVIQWVADFYDERYYRESAPGKKGVLGKIFAVAKTEGPPLNPKGPAVGKYRALKGSSWNAAPIDSRVSQRLRNKPEYSRSYVGFRLAAGAP